jgi:LysR family glycine cleavage system transcriptional activator
MPSQLPSLNAMNAFEVVARCRSFTRAAEILCVTPGAVSRQVKHLEAQIGQQLLVRNSRQLDLTPAGRELVPALSESFERIRNTVQDVRHGSRQRRLSLNVPNTLARRWLMPRLQRIRDAHPGLVLSVRTQPKDRLSQRGELDAAIRFGTGDWEALHSSHLFQEAHIAVAAPAVVDALTDTDGRVNLNRFPLLHVLKREGRYLTWQHWVDAAGLRDVDVEQGFEFDTLDLAIEAAIGGMGVTIADWHMVADDLAAGRLVQVLDTVVAGTQSYWLVRRPDADEHEGLRQFEDWVRRELATS